LLGKEGPKYFSVGDDNDEGAATSLPFVLPAGISRVKFLRAGGADVGSGLYVIDAASGNVLCAAESGTDTEHFFDDYCDGLDPFEGDTVQLFLADTQVSSWGAVYIDDIKCVDASGNELPVTPFLTSTTETSSTTESTSSTISTTGSTTTTAASTPAPTDVPTEAPTPEFPNPMPACWTILTQKAEVGDTSVTVESTDCFFLGATACILGGGNTEYKTIIGVGYPGAFSRSWSWWSGRHLSSSAPTLRVDVGLNFAYLPGSFVYITLATPTPLPPGDTSAPTPVPSPSPTPAPPSSSPTPAPTNGARDVVPDSCDGQCEAFGPEGVVCVDEPLRTLDGVDSTSEVGCMEECLNLGLQCQYFAYSAEPDSCTACTVCMLYETCTSFVRGEGGEFSYYKIFTIPLKADFIPAFYR